MEPWYTAVSLRQEVREGRSFNPDEFAIHLEQVVAGSAPRDYQDPAQCFSRTSFTRALREHLGMVLRRLDGRAEGTAPVLTLVTQCGGGKTHPLTALYHLARAGVAASGYTGIPELLRTAGLAAVPAAKVAVFVGKAWDPQPGRETFKFYSPLEMKDAQRPGEQYLHLPVLHPGRRRCDHQGLDQQRHQQQRQSVLGPCPAGLEQHRQHG
ncbi:MAG TPA: hypothetical protein VNL98_12425, partial [Gemmatimonadales bacterium]|nr:hypothetical protein [Gemmatimonadales bacterium]